MTVPLGELSVRSDSYPDGGRGNALRRSSGDNGLPGSTMREAIARVVSPSLGSDPRSSLKPLLGFASLRPLELTLIEPFCWSKMAAQAGRQAAAAIRYAGNVLISFSRMSGLEGASAELAESFHGIFSGSGGCRRPGRRASPGRSGQQQVLPVKPVGARSWRSRRRGSPTCTPPRWRSLRAARQRRVYRRPS